MFSLGSEYHAISIEEVLEVVPKVSLKPLENMPDYVRGSFYCRGKLLPVVDIAYKKYGRISQNSFSTRIMVMETNYRKGEVRQSIGLLVEELTDLLRGCAREDVRYVKIEDLLSLENLKEIFLSI